MKVHSFSKNLLLLLLCSILLVTMSVMAGCKGSDGSMGFPGKAGKNATAVDAGTFTFDDLRNIPLGGSILSVSTKGDKPVVTFQVINKNTNEGIRGLRTFSLHIAQLKPEANGSNSYWQNYITTSSTADGSFRPATDPVSSYNSATGALFRQGYSVVDNNDGTYVVTFGSSIKSSVTLTYPSRTGPAYYKSGSVPYDATLPHRIVVGVRSVEVPGVVGKTPGAYAGPINPVTGAVLGSFTNTNGANFAFDFIPSTGKELASSARDIVTIAACNQCHYKIQYGTNNTSGHFGSRTDTKTCVVCHTPQNVVVGQEATTLADFTPFIHKIHMGEALPAIETGLTGTFNEVTFPQDIRNCVWCHKGTDGGNWQTKPTRKACGSCHNNVNFETGANHPAPAGSQIQSDDHLCAGCHSPAAIASFHIAVAAPNPDDPRLNLGGSDTHTNAEYVAAAGVVPEGASTFKWVISEVTTSNNNPSITFKFQKDGSDVVFASPTGTNSELMPDFAGSPNAIFVWSVPSVTADGVAAPADFNGSTSGVNAYIRNAWNGGAAGTATSPITATMTGPAGGYYTLVITNKTVPATAKMLTGGIGYTYGSAQPPLVQTNLDAYPYTATTSTMFSGGLAVPAPNVWKVAKDFEGRRVIVDTAKCNTCHAWLGVNPTFHVGQRNDAPSCSFCHNPARTSSGWSINASTFIHAIHAADKRTEPFTYDSQAATADEPETGFYNITYPGILKNCEQCHVPGGYDFSSTSIYTAAQGVSNMLLITTATGTYDPTNISLSPYISAATGSYGPAGDMANLVNSPIASACFSCHDTPTARDHMKLNGGSIYETRATALTLTETCLICHGPAANTTFGDFVPAIKAVHRWW